MSSGFQPGVTATEAELAAPRYFGVQNGELLVALDPVARASRTDPLQAPGAGQARFPAASPPGGQHVLGTLDGRACVAVDVPESASVPDVEAVDLRRLWGLVSELDWSLASRAVQVIAWDRDHRFCGRCATPTEPVRGERARRCPACGLTAYPRLSPAVIVLVTRGERDEQVLLAWGRRRPTRAHSVLAGFVEVGESLEEAVRREVREETGVELGTVRYFGSQPWPFPSQLMVGFRARYTSGEISVQTSEIVEAGWFTRAEVQAMTTPRGSFSIAGWLIEAWLAEQRAPS